MIARLLRRLFPKPLELEHPVFGRLLFFKFKDPKRDYWEPQHSVRLNGLALEISVDADEAGPSEAQVAFAQKITGDKDALFEKCRSLLEPEYLAWRKGSIPEDVWRAFEWNWLSIPRDADDRNSWEVTFKTTSEPALEFTVYFQNGRADSVEVSN